VGAVLRVVDRRAGDGHRVVVSLQAPDIAPRECEATITLSVGDADAERVRWYLEDYAEFPADPAPQVARSVESVLASVGHALFRTVFDGPDAGPSWTLATAGPRGLGGLRVEVDADPADVPGLPWELLREPGTDQPIVLGAAEFVRTHRQAARPVVLPRPTDQPLRVLLVICRPGGRDDVPFRSVASRLVRSGADRMDGLELDVLRPPTFIQLSAVLRAAADAGRPYHVVHFDGHGAFLDATALAADPDDDLPVGPLRFGVAGPVRSGRHGYLVFEQPENGDARSRQELVDGPTLARVLVETGVPVLVLNACRSAYTEAAAEPHTPATDTAATGDVHDRIRAYGSLAAEVADAGVPGVVAMRYNVYVVTAAQFVADLYAHLVAGRSLGGAVTAARKALAASPTREIGPSAVQLQDWVVPTVYEPVPLQLRTVAPAGTTPLIRIDAGDTRSGVPAVPSAPDVGFFGRDETLLALDRAFDTHRIVLLHAFAGAGKSSTAAEFARWYTATGGLDDNHGNPGPVLWTSFEHYLPLPRVLDVVGAAFAPLLERSGIHWAAITDPAACQDLVVQVLAAVPVLWVWDNVEPVAGFPTGTASAWSADEQRDLVEFLRALKTGTRAKVLLTSRRSEDRWLGGLAVRVALPPMPMRERLQLASAVGRHHTPDTPPDGAGHEVDWRPLLRFTGGNPLTVTVTLRQALREQVTTDEEVDRFVARVQAGHTALEDADDAAQGRDASLAASLAYGFDRAFTEPERAQLAVLHLFRDTVHVPALLLMGGPDTAQADAVPALAGTDRGGLIALLDRAVEVGLLTGHGGGYYGIHPALPWFFTNLFTRHHGTPDSVTAHAAQCAYARAYATVARYYFDQVEQGRAADLLPVLRAEEANLLHGLALARTHQLRDVGLGCLQGLRQLYALTGRDVEWARLVADIEGDYLDPATDLPLPGREDQYAIVTGYRVEIARARRDWPTATRLQTAATAWDRDRAAPYRDLPAEQLDDTARHHLRALAVGEQDLGRLLWEQGDPACLGHYRAAYDLSERIGDAALQAIEASNLGNTYLFVPGLRDLDQAQHWLQRSLGLTPEHDPIGGARAHGSLANVAYDRFLDARAAGAPDDELITHLTTALSGHQQALDLLPADHHDFRATAHNQLGVIYDQVGDVPQAMHHYQQSIHHKEARGNTYGAGQTRYNIALLLADAGRPDDALHYARAAQANYREVGPGAAEAADEAQALIDRLERETGTSPATSPG
jgi:tetratricopeptide (TPR) repeat protein